MDTLQAPIILTLPKNGIRLRFDGPDQRLRLIEVLDFNRIPLTYKNVDVVKIQEGNDLPSPSSSNPKTNGPTFRHVYHKLFGPTFPGEYFPPSDASVERGTYILTYPGVALSFPLQHSASSPGADFVSVLSSSAASAAKCLSIFNGSSWKDACQDLYTRPCPHPRSFALVGRGKEACPDEIELVIVKGRGELELKRRASPSFNIVLNETTPQDLVAELGPPDAIYRKNDRRLSIHKGRSSSRGDHPPMTSGSPGQFDGLSDTDRSSATTGTDYSSPDEDADATDGNSPATECFYNYFDHGFDIFVSYPTSPSPELDPSKPNDQQGFSENLGNQLVVSKVLLHANIPGSYAFNRYRRSRWILDREGLRPTVPQLDSETPFSTIGEALREVWMEFYSQADNNDLLQRHMVLNRGWGDSPGSSCELLGGWEDASSLLKRDTESISTLGNTELYGFPGLLFEVLKNDSVSCLTIY